MAEHDALKMLAGQVGGSRPRAATNGNGKKPSADIEALERTLAETLGTKVNILHGRGGKGRLILHYGNLDTLDGLLARLQPEGTNE